MGSTPSAGTTLMNRISLALLLLLPSLASAQLRCPNKAAPEFTGHPFHPISCPGINDPSVAEKPLEFPPLPPAPKAKEAADKALAVLEGRWEGYVAFGMDRYEVLLVVERERRGWTARFEQKEHRILRRFVFLADGKAKGDRLTGEVTLAPLPGITRAVSARVGKGGKPFDVELRLAYDGEPELHRIAARREGESLRLLYQDAKRPAVPEATADLKPSTRLAL